MNAGKLKEEIRILSKSIAEDEYGGDSVQYVPRATTRAGVFIAKSDREFMNMGEFFGSIVTFHVRLYHQIANTDQIEWEGNKYRILSVFPDKTRQLVELKTELIKE